MRRVNERVWNIKILFDKQSYNDLSIHPTGGTARRRMNFGIVRCMLCRELVRGKLLFWVGT